MAENFIVNEKFEHISDVFASLDGMWRITYANRKACELVGRTAQALVGKVLWEEFPELHGTVIHNACLGASRMGVLQNVEMHGPGNGLWYSILAIPMDGGIHVYGKEITERKQAERKLAQNKEREAFLLKLCDALRPLADPLDIQRAAARVLGKHLNMDRAYYCDIIVENGIECFSSQQVYHVRNAPFHPGTAPVKHVPKLISGLKSGEMIVVSDAQADPRFDDEERIQYRSLQIEAVIIVPLIKNGKFVACFIVHQTRARNWTPQEVALVEETAERTWAAVERARAVSELRESQEKLKAELEGAKLLQSVSRAFFIEGNIQALYDKIVDAAAGLMHSQAASLQVFCPERGNRGELKLIAYKGFSQSTASGWEWVNISAGTPCATAWRTGSRVLVENIETCDFMVQTGTAAVFLQAGFRATQATPLYSRRGKLLGMISTHWSRPRRPNEQHLRFLDVLARQAADLIERRQAEAALIESRERALALNSELEEADRNKNEFLGSLSHELRNPLAAISVGLQIIGNARNNDQTDLALEIMKRQMNQLCRLVDDLLDLTRIRCNKIHLKKEMVDINALAALAGEDARQLFEMKGITLSVHMGCEPLYLNADPVRLKQMIGNLLHNAQKFTDIGGEADLSVMRDDKNAVICVNDNGIGIRQEMLPIVFEPFTQADHSLERSNGGLGLGLSIVRYIAQLHGGSADAFSEGLGKGSCFIIRLPLPEPDICSGGNPNLCNVNVCPLKILVSDSGGEHNN